MCNNYQTNNFVLELLSLQQDGKDAISAPTNWKRDPLLKVETDVDEVINSLAEEILVNNNNTTAKWFFFIGSPGNGKSAAIGKLCNVLTDSKHCSILTNDGDTLDQIESSDIPYSLDIIEPDLKFVSARIIQDASVVINPYSKDIDPAADLLNCIHDAYEKGISLIVCTNRGVLEKAYRDNYLTNTVNSTPWFKIITKLVKGQDHKDNSAFPIQEISNSNKKTVFSNLSVDYMHLDNTSLIKNGIFSNLLKRAIAEDNWYACKDCEDRPLCPFYNNHLWLSDEQGSSNFISLLKRAEVLSGQIIVFREALALISFILSGCVKDYGNNLHPCKWVHSNIATENYFSLAIRRIYMCLYCSNTPWGFDSSKNTYQKQIHSIKDCIEKIDANSQINITLSHILKSINPSTDVGLVRLIGPDGIIHRLDPLNDPLPYSFYEKWDVDYNSLYTLDNNLFSEIETKCIEAWSHLEELIDSQIDYSSNQAFWSLRRWNSNYLLHFGALYEGHTAFGEELDSFSDMLDLVGKKDKTLPDRKAIKKFEEDLDRLLNLSADNNQTCAVQLSESVVLKGNWVAQKLKPESRPNYESGSLSLKIAFQNSEDSSFNADMYLWLSRFSDKHLDKRCVPQEVLNGVLDARSRAAAKGHYAFENNDVILHIDAEDEGTITLTRYDGEVDVGHE